MAEREVYARAWATMPGIELTIGVGLRDERPEQIREMTTQLWEIAYNALSQRFDVYTAAVAYAEKRVLEFWPGRPYFIESEEEGRGVQVFQPWGLPVDHVAVPSPNNGRLVVPVDLIPQGATRNPPAPRPGPLTNPSFDLTGEEP